MELPALHARQRHARNDAQSAAHTMHYHAGAKITMAISGGHPNPGRGSKDLPIIIGHAATIGRLSTLAPLEDCMMRRMGAMPYAG